MASNLRRSKRTVGKRITDIDKKVERLRKVNQPTRVGESVISDTNLSADIRANNITAGTLTSIAIQAGTAYGSPVKYPFSVSSTGVVNAISGKIGSYTLSSTKLSSSDVFVSPLNSNNTITATTELATTGQIYTKYSAVDAGGAPQYYTEIYLNKADADGSMIVQGTRGGSLAVTDIGAHYAEFGGYLRHADANEGRFTGDGSFTYLGDGNANFFAMKIKNGSSVYSNVVGGRTVLIDSSGEIGTSGLSSIRYKQDVSNLSFDYTDVLKIQPVSFVYKSHAEAFGKSAETQVGVIAEQVEEIDSLRQLVEYTDDGVVDGFKYHVLPVYLLEVCRKQEEIIENLVVRVTELEAQK